MVGSFEGEGLVILLGVSVTDTEAEAVQVARKVAGLRMLDGEPVDGLTPLPRPKR